MDRFAEPAYGCQVVDSFTRLALQAGAGDTRALGRFVEAGYQEVWRFCASLAGAKAADDLCQEVFVRTVKGLPTFRGDSSARTWLLSIARHTCADELRASSRRRSQAAPAVGSEHVTVADPTGEVTVADLIGQLDDDRRTAFVLTQVVGLSYAEAAQVCDCPIGTIRSRVARARADLVSLMRSAGELRERRHA
jgi:RNA polymerase sigma-70 factor, ECF subfamily